MRSMTGWLAGQTLEPISSFVPRTRRRLDGLQRFLNAQSRSTISTQLAPFPAGYFCSRRKAPLDASIA